MITKLVIFAFFIGLLTVPVIASAVIWSKDRGISLSWWKWLLVVVWYLLLLFFILIDFTFIGEGEPAAGWKGLLFQLLVMIILGVGLGRLIFSKK